MRIIAGRWKGHRLQTLRGKDIRPTTDRVREAWMSALGGDLYGLRVVDLFAGSGALGLETLSRGAEAVTLVERARNALKVIRANLEILDAGDDVTLVARDVFRWLPGAGPDAFDVALADPPYGTGDAERLVHHFLEHPFARELWVEHPSRESLPGTDGADVRRYGDTSLTTLVAPQ